MKKSVLLFALIMSVSRLAFGQTLSTGISAGTLGTNNSFYGSFSGNSALATSSENSFFGYQSGRLITSGIRNVAIGVNALYSNTTGSSNVAIGYRSLYTNNGIYNTAIGGYSLQVNTSGNANTAVEIGRAHV